MSDITKVNWWQKFFLEIEKPSTVLNQLRANGSISQLPELYALIGCEQNARWHPEGDVWNHTLNCLDEFVAQRTGDKDDDLLLGFAVLCHDFGKPISSFKVNGEIHAHKHDVRSVKPVTSFLERLGADESFIDKVVTLTRNHMRVFALYQGKSSNNAVRRLMREVERVDILIKLNNVDECGRGMVPEDAGMAGGWLLKKIREIRALDARPDPLVRGSDLIELGYKPGKVMGELLRKVYKFQLNKGVENKKELLSKLKDNFFIS